MTETPNNIETFCQAEIFWDHIKASDKGVINIPSYEQVVL